MNRRDAEWARGERLLTEAFATRRPEMGVLLQALSRFGPIRVEATEGAEGHWSYTIVRLRDDGTEEPIPIIVRRRLQTQRATREKVALADRHAERALELQSQGKSRREIGEVLGLEDGVGHYEPETVKGWLARARSRVRSSGPTV